jgi:hypothetical protein
VAIAWLNALRWNNAVKTASSVPVTVTGGPIAVGTLVVVMSAYSGGRSVTSVVDDRGNTYTALHASGTATSSAIWASVLDTALQNNDTITVTLNGASSGALVVLAAPFTGATMTEDLASTGTGSTSNTPVTSVAAWTPPSARTLVIATIGVLGPAGDTLTEDTDTAGGDSWHQLLTNNGSTGGSATSNNKLISVYKITTSSASQIYGPTLGTSRGWGSAIVALREAGPPPLTRAADDALGISDSFVFSRGILVPDTLALTDQIIVPFAGQRARPAADLAAGGWTTAPLAPKLADQSNATFITGTLD